MQNDRPYFNRREFLIALGAGAPFSLLACGESESIVLRAGDEVIAPLAGWQADVHVERALDSQTFKTDDRACSVPHSLDVAIGDQVRVSRNEHDHAIYTVEQKRKQDDPNDVRMGLDARQRLGTSSEFSGIVSVPVVAQNLTDAQAQAMGEFVERVVDDGSNTGLVVLAPHGGNIEINTDLQAELMTTVLGCSSWICKGWNVGGGGAYTCWHVSSVKVSPRSFPGLGLIANRGFAHAVSFHGMTGGGILIGGTVPLELRKLVRSAIRDALSDPDIDVRVASDLHDGDDSSNVVNWLTQEGAGGLQIEQSQKVRTKHWQEVVTAVIGVYALLI